MREISELRLSIIATSNAVLTFRAEAPQCLGFGGGHIGQPQCPLIKVLVGEQVGKTHRRGVASNV